MSAVVAALAAGCAAVAGDNVGVTKPDQRIDSGADFGIVDVEFRPDARAVSARLAQTSGARPACDGVMQTRRRILPVARKCFWISRPRFDEHHPDERVEINVPPTVIAIAFFFHLFIKILEAWYYASVETSQDLFNLHLCPSVSIFSINLHRSGRNVSPPGTKSSSTFARSCLIS